MNVNFLFGMIHVSVSESMQEVLNRSCHSHLEIYRVTEKNDKVEFFCLIEQKKLLLSLFDSAQILRVTGLAGFLVHQLSQPFHYFLLIWVLVLYFVLSNTIFKIDFQSTDQSLMNEIQCYLKENQIASGTLVLDKEFEQNLKRNLKVNFLHDLSWVEVTRSASRLNIQFNHKETSQFHHFSSESLISTKHAVVVKFDVLRGNPCVKLNQVVHPGDALVQSYLIDSKGQSVSLAVSGKVYGMTWTTVYSEIDAECDVTVFDFLRLLYECRRQIETEISEDEKVLKENILQVTSSEGKIRISVLYTCIEDITKQ